MGNARTATLRGAPRILVHARGMDRVEEPVFWERLRSALRADGVELVVVSHNVPAAPMDVPWLQVPNGLDAPVWQEAGAGIDEAMRATWPGPGDKVLLDREAAWRPVVAGAAQQRQRMRGLYAARVFYAALLRKVRPALVVIWNGQHAQELVLGDLCGAMGCPVQFIERAFFPGMIQLDPVGILGGSSLARRTELPWRDAAEISRWRQALATLESRYRAGDQTWWEQPASKGVEHVRATLGIPAGVKVVLYAGQVDADAQNLLFSPNFQNGLEAFRWFCSRMPDDVFILGKHHPKSQVPAADYAAVVGTRGVWTEAVSLADALAVADRVAAVNSTVLYEALMHGKPALVLGDALLKGKGIAYETGTADDGVAAVIEAWLAGRDMAARLVRWQDFGAWALAHSFYAMNPALEKLGVNGSGVLASTLRAGLAESPPCWEQLTPSGKPVMVVAGVSPFWREDRGDLVRVAGLLRAIMAAGHEVHLFHGGTLASDDRAQLAMNWPSLAVHESGRALPRVRKGTRLARLRLHLAYAVTRNPFYSGRPASMAGETTLAQWFCPATRRAFRRLCRQLKPDAVLVQRVTLLYLVQGRRGLPPGCKVMVDTLDVMSLRASSFHAAGYAHWLDITRAEEQRVLRDADAVLAIQDEEASVFRELAPQAEVLTVLHAMPLTPLPLPAADDVMVLYAAAGGIANVAAIRDFLQSVWPAVQDGSGGRACLLVAGGVCGALRDAALPPGVALHGHYEDLPALMAKADIVINPVQFGGGLKIKNIEALCCGRPLVTSAAGAQGMREGEGTAFLTADSPSGMQVLLLELVRRPERRQALAAAGLVYASRTFSKDVVYAGLLDYLTKEPR